MNVTFKLLDLNYSMWLFNVLVFCCDHLKSKVLHEKSWKLKENIQTQQRKSPLPNTSRTLLPTTQLPLCSPDCSFSCKCLQAAPLENLWPAPRTESLSLDNTIKIERNTDKWNKLHSSSFETDPISSRSHSKHHNRTTRNKRTQSHPPGLWMSGGFVPVHAADVEIFHWINENSDFRWCYRDHTGFKGNFSLV